MSAAADSLPATGFASRLPADVYHALGGVSISRLKEMLRSPRHYRYRLANPKTSAPMLLGTAAHCATLEPERFGREFVTWSRRSENGNLCPRKGQYWDAFVLENGGRTIITEDEMELARAIASAVRTDQLAMRYLESGEPEVTMRWKLGIEDAEVAGATIDCRGRADWITYIEGKPVVDGLKTARDCRPFPCGAAAYKLGYHLQWAFYFDGFVALTDKEPAMKEIVVESDAPHDVAVYDIPQDVIEQGRADYQALLRTLAQCENENHWPGIAGGHELTFTLPTYAYEKMEDVGDLGLEV